MSFAILYTTIFLNINNIAQCQVSESFGKNSVFVDFENTSITEFIFKDNFTFGTILPNPTPKSNLDVIFALVCVDFTSNTCSDYIGFCPKTVFVVSLVEPFVSIITYRNTSAKYRILNHHLALFLNFSETGK